jgi:malate dehydrogenase (oxaloacetate-decarboxylating)
MLDFKVVRDKEKKEAWIETSLTGKPLLTTPQLNKATAFTEEERHVFGLKGKLPVQVETLQEQVMRAYLQYQAYQTELKRNIYLNNLHDRNQVLFYKMVKDHIEEMLPTIYTPIVGTAVKEFSREYRQARGLYITYRDQDVIEEILDNRSNPHIDVIVVTDGERVLGIGDQGIGAMDIPVAKLMLYTLCAGVDPTRTLPILLDVGTNNQTLLDDPLYLGLRHPRITGKDYDRFIEKFIIALKRKFPNVLLHWEDFGRENARRNLDYYRDVVCSFNDDIQGTAAVTLAAILAGVKAVRQSLSEQRIVIFGAGSAGVGIVEQICAAMVREGLSEAEARQRFWLMDRPGLLLEGAALTPEQTPYLRSLADILAWQIEDHSHISLLDVVRHVQPTVLIGCSSMPNAFDRTIIETMMAYVERPIIFPLSNPTEKAEAHPQDIFNWTGGKALIATGSPFSTVNHEGHAVAIAQCNNALVFPGIGLGAIAVNASRISDAMLWVACECLSEHAPILVDPLAPLLPAIKDAPRIARDIAIAVAKQACRENLTNVAEGAVEETVQKHIWEPHYLPYRLKS